MQAYRAHDRRTQMQRSASLPTMAPRTSGSEAQARGLRRLLNHSTRNTLRSHSSDSSLSPSQSQARTPDSQSSTQSTSASPQATRRPDPLVDPILRWWEDDSEDVRAQDRAAVEAELARYIAEGLIGSIENGADLLRYWTVSVSAC